jgi:hypothetical protein
VRKVGYMNTPEKYTVIGAGHSGKAMAVYLALITLTKVDFPIDDKAYQVISWQRPEIRSLLLDRKFYWSGR